MGLLDTISAAFKRRDAGSDDKWYDGSYTSDASALLGMSSSGIPVTPGLAIKAAAVYACVRVLGESVSSLPLPVYERLPEGGKHQAFDHPLYPILHDAPNSEMTAMIWREVVMGHLTLRGNHYSEIERSNGRPVALWPLHPDRMRLVRHMGQLVYVYQLPGQSDYMVTPEGSGASVESVSFLPEQILHIRGMSSNGLIGFSPITLAAEAIGLSLAASSHGARFFQNDASPGGVLEHPGKVSDPAHKRMKKSWEESHRGLSKAHRIAILEEGVQFKKIGLTNKEAQFLETRKFQRSEIAGIFRVPPHMIADMEKATFSNIEEQALSFVVHTLRPWLVRIEQEINKSLFFETERKKRTFFAEHIVDALLRGDIKSRYEAYSIGRQNGWLSADDVRGKENMNPLPDDQGKIYMVPLNMIPASALQGSSEAPTDKDNSNHSSIHRRRLAQAHEGIFTEAAGRVVRYERKNISDAVKKYLEGHDVKAFEDWIEKFYAFFPGIIANNMNAVFRLYAEAVQAVAAEGVNGSVGFTPEYEQFLNDYQVLFAWRHIGSSQEQLGKLIKNTEPAMLENAINDLLAEWNDNRPTQIAQSETMRLGEAINGETCRLIGLKIEE